MAKQLMVSQLLIHKDLIYNIRHNLSVNNDTEALYLNMINQKSKNIFINTTFTDSHLNIKKILKFILVHLSKNKNLDKISSW